MPDYQLYHLDDNGAFGDFDGASLQDDAEALLFARARFKGRAAELWSLGRRIATVEIKDGEPQVVLLTASDARRPTAVTTSATVV